MNKVRLEKTKNKRRLHIGSYFTDLNESEYRELVNIFSKLTDEQISDIVVKLMKENPLKFIQCALVFIGKDVYNSNGEMFKFSQNVNLAEGEKFKISVTGKIKKID